MGIPTGNSIGNYSIDKRWYDERDPEMYEEPMLPPGMLPQKVRPTPYKDENGKIQFKQTHELARDENGIMRLYEIDEQGRRKLVLRTETIAKEILFDD